MTIKSWAGHKAIAIYDVNDGQLVRPIAESLRHFANLAYHSETKRIGHLSSSQCSIFDLQGRGIFREQLDASKGVAWSPDGKTFITGGQNGIGVIDAVNGKVLTTIRGHAGTVNDVCFQSRRSPDCQHRQRWNGASLGLGHRRRTADFGVRRTKDIHQCWLEPGRLDNRCCSIGNCHRMECFTAGGRPDPGVTDHRCHRFGEDSCGETCGTDRGHRVQPQHHGASPHARRMVRGATEMEGSPARF